MGRYKKIAACMIAGVFLCFAGCNTTPSPSDTEKPDPITVNSEFDNLEKNQIYMYEMKDDAQTLRFQGMNYYLQLTASEGNISGVGVMDYPEKHYVAQDFSKIPTSEISLSYKKDDVVSKATGVQTVQNSSGSSSGRYWRMIEGGRYAQKIDVLKMVYDREQDIFGRLEVKAMRESFALTYEVWAPSAVNGVELYFDFESALYTEFSSEFEGRAAVLKDEENNGLAFILPSDRSVSVQQNGTGVRVACESVSIPAKNYTGFGILCVPFYNGDLSAVEQAIMREQVTVSAQILSPEEGSADTIFNASTGEFLIDGNIVTNVNYYDYQVEANRNKYDVFHLTFTNPTEKEIKIPFAVLKNTNALRETDRVFTTAANFGMSGMTPVLCDESGIPVGIPVQISKNWHSYASSGIEDVTNLYTGQWFSGTTEITVPAGSSVTYDYKIVYENWGEAANVSHSQLSLIGWDMYTLWEQLAVGSHGENICFYNYGNGESSWMQDIRPFMVTNQHGNDQQYNWSGNTGGAELLRYNDNLYQQQAVRNILTDYISQGPNLTDIVYGGITADGKIKADIRVNLVRTDDVTRVLFNFTYTFLEDTEFSRLTFFQYGTERYQSNYFKKCAYGNSEGIIMDGKIPEGNNEFLDDLTEQKIEVPGRDAWFMLYDFDSSIVRTETNGLMYIVRNYEANLNNKTYTQPTINLRKVGNYNEKQLSFELTSPSGVGRKIEKGGTVNLTIELVALPQTTDTWYGTSDYMTATASLFNTAQQGLQQAQNGHVSVQATTGNIKSSYPVVIETENSGGETVAQFSLIGGLGYVPVRFTRLNDYRGYELQIQKNGTWQKVDQSVKGNDFWQCDYNYANNFYTLTYNVKNTEGINFNATNVYRLVKIK